jgi:nucleotide-binding universal stress UspA family protein
MPRTILVPLDGSALAQRALPIALDLARRAGGVVHLIHSHLPVMAAVASGEGAFVTAAAMDVDASLQRNAREETLALADRLAALWGVPVMAHLAVGSPGLAICETAERVGADLIVMTTHGEGGFAPEWLGSVTDQVMRRSHIPVLALPENDAHGGAAFAPRSVLVALDGTDEADAILPAARDLALAFGARLEIVRVMPPAMSGDVLATLEADVPDAFDVDLVSTQAKDALDATAASLRRVGLDVRTTLTIHRNPTRALLEHIRAQNPDCVAVASHGRGLSRLIVGSVADKLIRASRRPVLVLNGRSSPES